MTEELTQQRLRELLHMECDGTFRRLVSLSHSVRVGERAGSISKSTGYVCVFVDGKRYVAHRLVWLYLHGRWPSGQIDHIDGVKHNNRPSNLREVNNFVNAQNKRAVSKNSSGLLGVSWMSGAGKWRAQICIDKKITYLGIFESKEEAHSVYLSAKRKMHVGCTI